MEHTCKDCVHFEENKCHSLACVDGPNEASPDDIECDHFWNKEDLREYGGYNL